MAVNASRDASAQEPAPPSSTPAPVIRRPRPTDAIDLAQATFLAGARIEISAVAAQLAVSQGTIYRWFGTREHLIEQVVDAVSRDFIATTRAEAEGEGDERVLDFIRRFMEATVTVEHVRAFVAREPQLALRVLLGENGVVRRTLRETLTEVIAETRSPQAAKALEDEVDVLVEVGVALEWATFAIGDRPQIDHAIHIMRVILAAHAAR